MRANLTRVGRAKLYRTLTCCSKRDCDCFCQTERLTRIRNNIEYVALLGEVRMVAEVMVGAALAFTSLIKRRERGAHTQHVVQCVVCRYCSNSSLGRCNA